MGTNRSKRSAKKTSHGPESAGGNGASAKSARRIFVGSKTGRNGKPTYSPDFAHRAKLLRQKGATAYDLAIEFDVARNTIFEWQAYHEDFAAACKVDRVVLDNRVKESLYDRAIGYEYPGEEVRQVRGQILKVSLLKHMPADVSALKFWLTNCKPKEWSTRPEMKPAAADGNPLAKLYESICGTKLMPNEDQTAYLESGGNYIGPEWEEDDDEQPKKVAPDIPKEDET